MRVPSRFLVLLTIVSSLLALSAARAETAGPPPQGAEKRIALVIGNAAYQAGALATPANDAGLVAQTLQAAGFDVVGARDLDEDSLRRSLRDFTDKAAASGPDTVAFVYLAGYGLQLNGENYFVPVDAAIGSAADVPVRALRVSDYKRQLASLKLKARFVVIDAARKAPFATGAEPLAGGLALTEAEPGSLVAFNAAPGTVGPEEKGPYGAYAQALVEMIREGGLQPAELFDRVRLRVSETTKGGEVPWNASRIETPFVFLQRAADAPPLGQPDQVAALETRPIRELGAKDAYAACLRRDSLQGYQDFVAAYPQDALARRVRALIAARREAVTWRRTYLADTPDGYWSYLSRYPRGPHAWDARRRLRELAVALEPPPQFAYLDYDVPPPPPEEIVYVERPVLYFDDPVYALPPPPPPPAYFLPPPPAYIVDLAPPPPVAIAYALPSPAFVPVPAYVSAPAYIAPPPNNVYFGNIHNTTVINEINAQNLALAREPRGGLPAGAVIGAGAVTGAALGAAAARVALPAALARKAALGGNLPPGANPGLPQGAQPGFPQQANRPGGFGQPGAIQPNAALPNAAPGAPARPGFGQPLPGQNGQTLPLQANRPPGPGQLPIAPNGPLAPQANRPGAVTGLPNGQPVIPQNPQPLAPRANRAGGFGQPALGANGPVQPQGGRQGGFGQVAPQPSTPGAGPGPAVQKQQADQLRQQQMQAVQAQRQQAAAQAAAQRQQLFQQQQVQRQQAAQQQQAAIQQRALAAQQRALAAQQQQAAQRQQMMQQQQAAQRQQMMMQQQQQAAQRQQQMMQQQAMQRAQQPQRAPPSGNPLCRPGLPCR